MMEFIAELERKVERMKAESETAAEELIELRGRHQSLKKTHQLLTQRLAEYVEMSRRQEQLLSVTQQEITDLREKRRFQGGIVDAASPLEMLTLPLPPNGKRPVTSTPIAPYRQTPPAAESLSPTGVNGTGAVALSDIPTATAPPAVDWIDGGPLPEWASDIYESSGHLLLPLHALFGDEGEPIAVHRVKRNRV